ITTEEQARVVAETFRSDLLADTMDCRPAGSRWKEATLSFLLEYHGDDPHRVWYDSRLFSPKEVKSMLRYRRSRLQDTDPEIIAMSSRWDLSSYLNIRQESTREE